MFVVCMCLVSRSFHHYIVEHFQSQWIKLLQSTSSVKYLHIKPEVKGKVLQIFNMLEQCPQIIQLKLSLNCPCKITCSMDHYAVYPMIRHLELVIGRSNADLVPQLFKHFPGLRVLRLSIPIASYENMDMIRHYFPKLQQLVLGGDYDVHDPEKGLFQQADLEGLRLLSIQSSFHGDSTARLLQQYATTVESVEMLTLPSSIPSIRSLLDDPVVLYRLRSLRYHADVRFHRVDFIQWIILRAPNIQFVEAISGGVEGTLLQMLTHRHVKRINLEWSTLSMSQGQHEFLQHHVHLGKTSPLLDLKCDIVWPFTGRECWLYLIPELQQLKSLEIFVAYYDRDEDEWINLLSHVARGCSSLEKITFTFSTFCSPREWILPLSQHPHLKSLVIVSGVVSNDMLPTLEHFRHLESLHLKLRSFDWKAIAGLKSKMPRLVCTTQNAHQ